MRNYSDTICIICREEMASEPAVPGGRATESTQQIKKLPCDHIFHKSCLRSWFQRQQTCPTCRTSILRLNPNGHVHGAPAAGAAVPPQAQAQQQQQQGGAAAAPGANIPGGPNPNINAQSSQPINPFARTSSSTNVPASSSSQQIPTAPQIDIFNSSMFHQQFTLPPFCKINFFLMFTQTFC